MESSVKQRLILYLKNKKIGQTRFEKLAGLSTGYISNLKNSPSVDKAEKILMAAPDLNRVWLLTGEGDMIIGQRNETTGIPYYDEDLFECGPGAGFGEVMLSGKEVGKLLVPGVPSRDVFAVRAHGDSMVNHDKPERSIPNGALVVLRRSSLNAVQWGEVYALATSDGYIVKRLMPSEREGCVKCVSFNSDEYPAFDLAVADIYDYAMVVAVVCSSLW